MTSSASLQPDGSQSAILNFRKRRAPVSASPLDSHDDGMGGRSSSQKALESGNLGRLLGVGLDDMEGGSATAPTRPRSR